MNLSQCMLRNAMLMKKSVCYSHTGGCNYPSDAARKRIPAKSKASPLGELRGLQPPPPRPPPNNFVVAMSSGIFR